MAIEDENDGFDNPYDDDEALAEYAEQVDHPLRDQLAAELGIENPKPDVPESAPVDPLSALVAERMGTEPSEDELKAQFEAAKQAEAMKEWVEFARQQKEANRLAAEIARANLVGEQPEVLPPEPSVFEQMSPEQFREVLKARDAGLDFLPVQGISQESLSLEYADYSRHPRNEPEDES